MMTASWRSVPLASLPLLLLLLLAVSKTAYAGNQGVPPPLPQNGAWVGDFGHSNLSPVALLNSTGEDFTITFHRYNWVFPGRWNQRSFQVSVIGPHDVEIVSETVATDEEGVTLTIPGIGPGVYHVGVRIRSLNYWHLTTSLPRAVSVQGVPSLGRDDGRHWFRVSPKVPRTWYFFVPEGTPFFSLRSISNTSRSQREDHALIIRTPRGQRIAALWDQPNPTVRNGEIVAGRDEFLEDVAHVVVEPGSDGRFWSVEVGMGDAHIWSSFEFALEGVPPHLAQAPEMWFNPETGEIPQPLLYDDEPFVRKDLPADEDRERPYMHYWMPAPAIGDNASNQLRTPARIALWNPEGRTLKLVLRDYIPRAPENENEATVRIKLPDTDKPVTETTAIITHSRPFTQSLDFTGVSLIDVEAIDRFWAYTYPATPAVLVGQEADDGWQRLHLEAGTQRHWFFHVPKGTEQFTVRTNALYPHDVVDLAISAPDRTLGRIYGRQGETTIAVPPGLAGKIWHFSINVGSATRYYPSPDTTRPLVVPFDLDLRGVPALLAPTWGQWFDPNIEAQLDLD